MADVDVTFSGSVAAQTTDVDAEFSGSVAAQATNLDLLFTSSIAAQMLDVPRTFTASVSLEGHGSKAFSGSICVDVCMETMGIPPTGLSLDPDDTDSMNDKLCWGDYGGPDSGEIS